MGVAIGGAASIGLMAAVNFIIDSDFKWALLAMALLWAFSLGLFWIENDAAYVCAVFEVGRYEGWMQYAAALGNGIASYELALHYRRVEQPLLAAQFESRARELGYTPPPSLDNSRK